MPMHLGRSSSLLAALAFTLIGISACSADATIDAAESVVVAPTVDQADQAAQPDEPAAETPTTAAVDAAEPAAPTETSPAPSGGGSVQVVFDDGRSWTLDTGDCYTAPDSPFGIFFMSGTNADGAELIVVESWPLSGDKSGGTAFIATFTDETGAFYTAEGGPVSEAAGALSFESRVYEGLALEPTINGVFSCTP